MSKEPMVVKPRQASAFRGKDGLSDFDDNDIAEEPEINGDDTEEQSPGDAAGAGQMSAMSATSKKCGVCLMKLKSLDALEIHIQNKHMVRFCMLTCYQCQEKCVTPEQLIAHMSKEHPEVDDMCGVCGEHHFPLKKHIMTSHYKRYRCDVCKKRFLHLKRLETHMRLHEKRSNHHHHQQQQHGVVAAPAAAAVLWQCDICNKQLSNLADLQAHERSTHLNRGQQALTCLLCGENFHENTTFNTHMMSVHPDFSKEACPVCDCPLVGNEYKEHVREHFYKYRCDICGALSNRKDYAIKHRLTHDTDATSARHDCPECGHAFKTEAALNNHVSRQHAWTPAATSLECSVCGDVFTERLTYIEHKRRKHSAELPLQCRFCDDRFADAESLATHEFTHTGVSDHHCCICNVYYSSERQLDEHSAAEHGAAPDEHAHYTCPVCTCRRRLKGACATTVTAGSSSATHDSAGAPQKRQVHKCPKCSSYFVGAERLREHLAAAHGDNDVFQCSVCLRKFTTKLSLVRHKSLAHGKPAAVAQGAGRVTLNFTAQQKE